MFGKAKSGAAGHTLIDANARIVGDIHFTGALHVQGNVQGNIVAGEAGGELVVGPGGLVEGEIRSPVVTVSGEIRGDIHSTGRIKLEASALVVGNIHYRLIEIVVGARIDGLLRHAAPPPSDT